MPIYEYECAGCRRRVSLLIRSITAAIPPACPRCGGTALTRLMSRFTTIKSEDARLEAMADAGSFGDVDENDPASVARFMKKMGKEFGDELGDDFESAVDEAMAEGEAMADGDSGPEEGGGAEGGGTESVDTAGASDL